MVVQKKMSSNRKQSIFCLVMVALFGTSMLFSTCTKDRLITYDPPPEIYGTWLGDSIVVLQLLTDSTGKVPDTLMAETNFTGSLLPDTFFFNEPNTFAHHFHEDTLSGIAFWKIEGTFFRDEDSLVLTHSGETTNHNILVLSETQLTMEQRELSGDTITTHTGYYQRFDPNSEISFRHDIMPIFEDNCANCHISSNPTVPIHLYPTEIAFAELLTKASTTGMAYVDTTDPAGGSFLYLQLINAEMPPNNGPLPDFQIESILKWIEQGAQNN